MNWDYRCRSNVALTLVIALALVSDLYFALTQKVLNTGNLPTDIVTRYQERFEGLRRILPRHALVGYLGERDDVLDNAAAMKNYYLTQYSLAPVVIAPTTAPALVVGNFYDGDPYRISHRTEALMLVIDFGNGVQLLRHRER